LEPGSPGTHPCVSKPEPARALLRAPPNFVRAPSWTTCTRGAAFRRRSGLQWVRFTCEQRYGHSGTQQRARSTAHGAHGWTQRVRSGRALRAMLFAAAGLQLFATAGPGEHCACLQRRKALALELGGPRVDGFCPYASRMRSVQGSAGRLRRCWPVQKADSERGCPCCGAARALLRASHRTLKGAAYAHRGGALRAAVSIAPLQGLNS